MNFLGEYEKGTDVLLELDLKRKNGTPAAPDSIPNVKVECYESGGITVKHSGPMEISAPGRYIRLFNLSGNLQFGDYTVTYTVVLRGKMHETKERFRIVETNDFIQQNKEMTEKVIDLITDEESEDTNMFDAIADLKGELKLIKEKIRLGNEVKTYEKVKVTSDSLVTPKGMKTRVYYQQVPLENAKVRACIEANQMKIIAEETKTNSLGDWQMMLYPREYEFEFLHPSGMLLFRLRKEVKP